MECYHHIQELVKINKKSINFWWYMNTNMAVQKLTNEKSAKFRREGPINVEELYICYALKTKSVTKVN